MATAASASTSGKVPGVVPVSLGGDALDGIELGGRDWREVEGRSRRMAGASTFGCD